jgi:hypothetical protein
MAVILKPRSNKQGIVDTSADLIKIEGRENYTVLVKDLGVFEWVVSGTVDSANIFAGKNGFWSRVLQSAEGLLAYTAEDQANKSTNVITDGASDVKYPSVKATKTYADSLVTGLLDDRGNFTPGLTSPGAWPTTGGSGTAGAIMKGDIWFCSASGFMGTTAVVAGSSFRAIVDTPGQTAGNWNVLSAGAITSATPSLQQVTDAGATTNDSIFISGISGGILSTATTTDFGSAALITFNSQGGAIELANTIGDIAAIRCQNINGNRTYQLPNASGTLALTSDVVLPYKVYTASLTFSGTSNPTVTVYQNTIGNGSGDGVNDIAITIQNFGLWFEVNMTGSTAFPAGKTWMQPSLYFGNSNLYNVYFYRMSNTQIRFQSIDTTDNSVSFANGFSVNFEIRVYP